jgi:hypothetical protein
MTSILGLELGSTLEQAHAKLDRLTDPKHPPKTEREGPKNNGESEQKVLWQLAKTDYSFVFVKSDENERITSINAFLRPGKEIPFEKIGEAKKAPVQDANTIAWDVLLPKSTSQNSPIFCSWMSACILETFRRSRTTVLAAARPTEQLPCRTWRLPFVSSQAASSSG